MKKLPFVKMHGLGNDFVIIKQEDIEDIHNITNFAYEVSHRRTGIGCDQFVTYKRESDHILMKIYNQDGSSAKACGNATRCLARLMFDKYGDTKIKLIVEDREIVSQYIDVDNIKVNMGECKFEAPWMPKLEELWELANRYVIEPKEIICVDVGNPHLIIFSKLSEEDKEIIGKNIEKTGLFKEGININFATLENETIHLKVWERGTGFTLSCGSGACATFAAAIKLGFIEDQAKVIFDLGSLEMSNHTINPSSDKLQYKESETEIIMCGPATYVFFGQYDYHYD